MVGIRGSGEWKVLGRILVFGVESQFSKFV